MSCAEPAAWLAKLGPFFAVEPVRAAGVDWQPLRTMVADPSLIGARVGFVRQALAAGASGEVEIRVAASVTHLGVVGRLLAPQLGAAVGGFGLAGPGWWTGEFGGPYPLSFDVVADRGAGPVLGVVDQVSQLVAEYGVPARTLAGNVTSALNGAVGQLTQARPDLALAAQQAAAVLIAGCAAEPGRPGPGFRRHSCCLIYRAGTGRQAVCGDCVLAA